MEKSEKTEESEKTKETEKVEKSELDTAEEESKHLQKKEKSNWNLKWKNNLSRYVTVEPLLCVFLFQYLIKTFVGPYTVLKECGYIGGDPFLCSNVTSMSYLKNKNDQEWLEIEYRFNSTYYNRIWNDPEIADVYDMLGKINIEKTNETTVVWVFARTLQFLIMFLVSDWSDKHSKRKMCLWIPLCGQLAISIGLALFNHISYQHINYINIGFESLTGGQELMLFGCFCYMSKSEMKRNIFIGLGLIGLIVSILRHTQLHDIMLNSNTNGEMYTCAITSYLLFIIICLSYVKFVLNELKRPQPISEIAELAEEITEKNVESCSNGHSNGIDNIAYDISEIETKTKVDVTETESNISKSKNKKSVKELISHAFFLDVVQDYVNVVKRKRIHNQRRILILFLVLAIVANSLPFHNDRICLTITDAVGIDDVDFLGAVLVITSILVILSKTNDTITTIIATLTAPTLYLVLKVFFVSKSCTFDYNASGGVFDHFKGLIICAVMLLIVEDTEFRIYLIFKAVSWTSAYSFDKIYNEESNETPYIIISFILLIIMFCGFGLFYKLMKQSIQHKLQAELKQSDSKENPNVFDIGDSHNSKNKGS